MSKRAEQRGLEALPPRWRKTKDGKGKIDSALPVRKFYIRTYEQAEKETIDRVIDWLQGHSNDYIFRDNYKGKEELKVSSQLFEDLRNTMEDRQ